MSAENEPYEIHATRQNGDKALQTLDGILTGITIDGIVTPGEVAELRRWLGTHELLVRRHPVVEEAVESVRRIISDNQVDAEELLELRELCRKLHDLGEFYNYITHAIQKLHGILHGVLADGVVSAEELTAVRRWLENHEDIRQYWPLAEIETILIKALRDKRLDNDELLEAAQFFASFTGINIPERPEWTTRTVRGVCATDPQIEFTGKRFCVTGRSEKAKRAEIEDKIRARGGRCEGNPTDKMDYLVICAAGSKCWAYAGYGRKVEFAMEQRRQGKPVMIVHEIDLWDALND